MENKEIVSSGKMSQHLIGNWLLWGLVLGIIYSFIFPSIIYSIESIVLQAIIVVIAQGMIAVIAWKLSTSSSFEKKTIYFYEVQNVMKNLSIATILFCILTGIYNISSVNSSIDQIVNSNYQLQFTESMMSSIYSDEKMVQYNKEKEAAIADAKIKANTYLVILEVGLTVVYLAVLPLEKKEILKYLS